MKKYWIFRSYKWTPEMEERFWFLSFEDLVQFYREETEGHKPDYFYRFFVGKKKLKEFLIKKKNNKWIPFLEQEEI